MNPSKRVKRDFIYFHSGSYPPWNKLSNLSGALIQLVATDPAVEVLAKVRPELVEWCPATFASAEHLWKSLQASERESFNQFQIDGRWGQLTVAAMEQLYSKSEAESKYQYWSKNGNVGIVAKLASNPKRHSQLGMKMLDTRNEKLEAQLEKEIWVCILELKYKQNPTHLATLQYTGCSKLIEFDRFPKKTTHWGGQYIGGELIGENVMGQYMEIVREKLCPTLLEN